MLPECKIILFKDSLPFLDQVKSHVLIKKGRLGHVRRLNKFCRVLVPIVLVPHGYCDILALAGPQEIYYPVHYINLIHFN